MPFRSDIKPENYGKDSRKPIDVDKVKAESKEAIRKLKKEARGTRVPFFLHDDYYDDEFPFLAIGISTGLEKRFKKQKNLQEVSYGTMFLDDTTGKDVIFFEYVERQGKLDTKTEWERAFKVLEKWFVEDCQMVPANDEDVDNEEDEGDETTGDTAATDAATEDNVEKTQNVLNMEEQYGRLVDYYEETIAEQNDPHDYIRLYKGIKQWEQNLTKLSGIEQLQLEQLAANIDDYQDAAAQRIKANRLLDNKVQELIPLVVEYEEDFADAKKATLLEKIENIDEIAKALLDEEILEQTQELKNLLTLKILEDAEE